MNLSSSRRSPEGVCPASQPASRWSEKINHSPLCDFPQMPFDWLFPLLQYLSQELSSGH